MVEDVAFDQGVGVLADVEGVTGVVEPVVVIGVPVAVEFELWGATGGVMNVVAGAPTFTPCLTKKSGS